MENIVLRPTPDILKACNLLDEWIHAFLDSRRSIQSLGKYEAPIESLNIMYLMIRNVESIIILAKKDLVLLPSAKHLTRSVLDMAMKINWMLAPSDPFEQEVRWLAQLQTEETFYDKLAKHLSKIGRDNSDIIKLRDNISDFRLSVIKVLPQPYKPLTKMPNMADMMKEIHEEGKYVYYMFLSQYTHGTHIATETYRHGLGNGKVFGEHISSNDWYLVFSACWYCLTTTGERIYVIFDGDTKAFLAPHYFQGMAEAINNIKNS